MSKRPTGLTILAQGELWRTQYLAGTPLSQIAHTAQKSLQDVSRAVWLAKIPAELKELIRAHPETFTRTILINVFAAKRRQCETNGFNILKTEVGRLINQGVGTQPELKKTNAKAKPKIRKSSSKQSSASTPQPKTDYTHEVAYRIREALGFHCKVSLGPKGESTVTFRDKAALEDLLIAIEPHLFK